MAEMRPSVTVREGTLDKMFGMSLSFAVPDYIVEVGTYDGEGVKKFGQYSPRSGLVAFEGNPYNYFNHCIGKPVHNLVVSDKVGKVIFNEPTARPNVKGYQPSRGRRVSSIMPILDATEFETYEMISTTLDTFFEVPIKEGATFALILDVEGAAWNVLKGAEKFLQNTVLLKIEVERVVSFEGQKLLGDVEDLIINDFRALGSTEIRPNQIQHNRYYTRRNDPELSGYFTAIIEEAMA